jgi:hypothetical protein
VRNKIFRFTPARAFDGKRGLQSGDRGSKKWMDLPMFRWMLHFSDAFSRRRLYLTDHRRAGVANVSKPTPMTLSPKLRTTPLL